jgi:acetyl esterase/lipase
MSWLLLLLGIVSLGLVANAFIPVRRNIWLFLPSFMASWLAIELAWLNLVVDLALTSLLVWAGALDHWVGWIGLVLSVLSWILLLVTIVWSRGTSRAAEVVLAEVGVIDDPGPRHTVSRTRNVPYARVGGRVLKLDVFAPSDRPNDGTRRPALLQVHGGAWIIGDKREQGIPLLKALARDGWVGFNANYRLSPAATWPDHLIDLKRALAFIREHADEYGIDPDFVAVTGGSAGGHLATMLALTQGDPRVQPGFEDADTSVQACVPFYGVYDFTNRAGTMPPQFRDWFLQPLIMKAFYDEEPQRFSDASPLDNLRPDVPPFLVVHGDNDTLAPVADARAFVAALREVSTTSVHYLELRGAQHAFDVFTSVRTRRVVRAVERFLGVQWRSYLRSVPEDRVDPTTTPGPAPDDDVDTTSTG